MTLYMILCMLILIFSCIKQAAANGRERILEEEVIALKENVIALKRKVAELEEAEFDRMLAAAFDSSSLGQCLQWMSVHVKEPHANDS